MATYFPEKMNYQLIHAKNELELKPVLSQISAQSLKFKGHAPRTKSILNWMNKNIRYGISSGLQKRKIVRNDLEILRDREANCIEFCVLFYSLAHSQGVDCSFGRLEDCEDSGGAEDEYPLYFIFAKEGNETLAISPYKAAVVAPDYGKITKMDAAEFFRRVAVLSKLDSLSVMHATPLLYALTKDGGVWLYRPQPNILSLTVVNENDKRIAFRYIVGQEPHRYACTLIDYKKGCILTSSKDEFERFSTNKGSHIETITLREGREEVIKQARQMVSKRVAGILFGNTTKKLLEEFSADAKGHYDHAYA